MAGDLSELFEEHHAFVWRVIRRLGVPESQVEDAVQDVFVVLHRRWSSLHFGGSARPLLYGVARRVARRARDRVARSDAGALTPVAAPDPEAQLQTRDRARVVMQALDAMDEDKRMTFLLAEAEGMSVPEVAQCMGCNLHTVYSRLRVARERVDAAIARYRAREQREERDCVRRSR